MFLELFKLFFKNIIPLNEEEYNLKSHKFNPIKLATVAILVASLVFNVVILYKLGKFHTFLMKECPAVLADDKDGLNEKVTPPAEVITPAKEKTKSEVK